MPFLPIDALRRCATAYGAANIGFKTRRSLLEVVEPLESLLKFSPRTETTPTPDPGRCATARLRPDLGSGRRGRNRARRVRRVAGRARDRTRLRRLATDAEPVGLHRGLADTVA